MSTRAKLLFAVLLFGIMLKPALATVISLDIKNDYHIPVGVIYRSTNNTVDYVLIPAQGSETIETTSPYVLIGTPLFRHLADYWGYGIDDFLIVGVSKNIGLLPTNPNGHFSLTLAPNNGQWFIFLQSGHLDTGEKFSVFFNWSLNNANYFKTTIELPPFPIIKAGYGSIGDGGGITSPFMDLVVDKNGSAVRILRPAIISSANTENARISISVGNITISNHSIAVFLTKSAFTQNPSATPVLSVFIDKKLAVQLGTSALQMVDARDPASVFVASSFVSINNNHYAVLAYLPEATAFNYSKAKLIMINLANFSDVKVLTPSSGELYGLDKLSYIPIIDDRLDPIPLLFIMQASPPNEARYENALYLRYFIIHASTETQIPLRNISFTSFLNSGVFASDCQLNGKSFVGLWNINPLLFISYITQKTIYVVNNNETILYNPNYAVVYDVKTKRFFTFAQLVDNYTNVTFVNVSWPSSISSSLTVNYSKVMVADYLTFNPAKDFHKPTASPNISSQGGVSLTVPTQPSTGQSSSGTTNSALNLTSTESNTTPELQRQYNLSEALGMRCSVPCLIPTTKVGKLNSVINAVYDAKWPSNDEKTTITTFLYPSVAFAVQYNQSTPFERFILNPYYQYLNESMTLKKAFQFWVFVSYKPDSIPKAVEITSKALTVRLEHFITYTENGVTYSAFLLPPDELQAVLLMVYHYLVDKNARPPALILALRNGSTVTAPLTTFSKKHAIPTGILKLNYANQTLSYDEAFPPIRLGEAFLPTMRFFVMDYTGNYLMRMKLSSDYLIEFAFVFSQDTLSDFNNFVKATAQLLYLKQPYVVEWNDQTPLSSPYKTIPLNTYVFYSTNNKTGAIAPSSTDYTILKYSRFVVIYYTHILAPAVQNPLANSIFELKVSFYNAGIPAVDTIPYKELISHLNIVKLYDKASSYIIVPPKNAKTSETILLNLSTFSDLFQKDFYKRLLVQFTFNLTNSKNPDFALFHSYERNEMIIKTTKATFDSIISNVAGSPNSLILFLLIMLFIGLYTAFDVYIAHIITLAVAILLRGAFTSLSAFITTLVAIFIIGNLVTRGVAFLRKNGGDEE